MSEWYYAQDNQQRQGPLTAEALAGLFRDGRIALATLVWREGQAQWQPLGDFADELNLLANDPVAPSAAAEATPPPLAAAYANAPGPGPAAPAPPRPGLSGCMIALIIGVIGGVILLAILGIMAAIAIPAYSDYTTRAKTTRILSQLQELKTEVVEYQFEHEVCPVNGDPGFDPPESYALDDIGSVKIGRFDESGHCGIEATVAASDATLRQFDGKLLWLEYDAEAGTWLCSSDIDDKHLPTQCRSGS